MKTVSRLILVLFFAASGALSGCGGEGREKLRFWQFWDLGVIEPMIADFERSHPGIEVEVEQLTWQSGLEKIQAAIASGTEPDLCELGSTWVPRFSYEGVLEDLSESYQALADSFMAWDSARWQGRVYGLPWVQGSRVLFYNRQLFAAAGLDPKEPPVTWVQLMEAAKRIDGLGEGIRGFGVNLGERYILYKKFMPFAWGNGGDILSPENEVVFDSRENLEALEFYKGLTAFSLLEKQEVLDHAFKTGKLGMQISGAWNIRNLKEEAPDLDYGVALVPRPSPDRGVHASFVGAEMLVIFRDSRHKEAALELARFLHAYPQARRLGEQVESVFPASKHVLDDDSLVRDSKLDVFVQQALTSRSAPAHPGWVEMESVINTALEQVLYDRKNAADALREASGELRAITEKYR